MAQSRSGKEHTVPNCEVRTEFFPMYSVGLPPLRGMVWTQTQQCVGASGVWPTHATVDIVPLSEAEVNGIISNQPPATDGINKKVSSERVPKADVTCRQTEGARGLPSFSVGNCLCMDDACIEARQRYPGFGMSGRVRRESLTPPRSPSTRCRHVYELDTASYVARSKTQKQSSLNITQHIKEASHYLVKRQSF